LHPVIKLLLSNEKVRNALIAIIGATLGFIFLMIFAIMSAPWALLTGFFGGEVDFDKAFAAQSRESYIEEFDRFAGNPNNSPVAKDSYVDIIYPPLLDTVTTAEPKVEDVAKEVSEAAFEGDRDEVEYYGIVYTDFTQMDGTLNVDPIDAGMILSMYNNVGWEWDWYKENAPEVLEEMSVPKGHDGEFIGELASVDMDKLIKLLKKNKNDFFKVHLPTTDGGCSLGDECTLGHNDEAGHKDVGSHVPTTWGALATSGIEQPYFGIYYYEYTGPRGDGEDVHEVECGEYLAVGFIEYRGFSFFEERLRLSETATTGGMIGLTYANLREILGREHLTDASTAGAAALISYDPVDKNLMFTGLNQKPIRKDSTDGAYISAVFNDPSYFFAIGSKHNGVDIAGVNGASIYCGTARGEIVGVYHGDTGFGNHVKVYNGRDNEGNKYFTTYAHMNSTANLSPRQTIGRNIILGSVGSSGFSTGPHLHYELQIVYADGSYAVVDPTDYGFRYSWYGLAD